VLPSESVDARTQSALLAAIVTLALAVAMLLRKGRTRLWTAFALLNVALLVYELGDFLAGVLHVAWPLRLTLVAAGFVPSAVLGFLVEFQGDAGRGLGLRRLGTASGLVTRGADPDDRRYRPLLKFRCRCEAKNCGGVIRA